MRGQTSSAVTVPCGYVKLTISPGNGTVGLYNFISLPLQGAATGSGQFTGRLTGVSSNTLANSNGAWNSGALAVAGSPFFIKITSGTALGRIFQITANTANQLTVDNQGVDLTTMGLVTGSLGDGYEIFPGDTLISVFGTPADGVVGGTDPNGAVDRVILLNNGVWDAYYYNTSAGQWRKGVLPFSQNNTVVRPDSGLIYSRVGTAPLSYVLIGRVPDKALNKLTLSSGLTAVAAYFPTVQTLGGLNLQSAPGWKKAGDVGVTAANADKVCLNETGVWDEYYFDGTSGQWRKGVLPFNQNTKALAVGTAILINRTNGGTNATVTLTPPYQFN